MQRIRFRSLEEAAAGERVLEQVVAVTVLPGGHLAVLEFQLDAARQALTAARIEFRDEPIDEFLGGRVIDEEREEGQPSYES